MVWSGADSEGFGEMCKLDAGHVLYDSEEEPQQHRFGCGS